MLPLDVRDASEQNSLSWQLAPVGARPMRELPVNVLSARMQRAEHAVALIVRFQPKATRSLASAIHLSPESQRYRALWSSYSKLCDVPSARGGRMRSAKDRAHRTQRRSDAATIGRSDDRTQR
jgi:hypothetical protein